MTGINPADVAAGVMIAAFFLGVLLWGFKTTEQPAGRFFAVCFLILGTGLVWWRVSCWTGHMVCT
jgi:hypothetical protein